jgi:cilia- and flagella-associated protein 44
MDSSRKIENLKSYWSYGFHDIDYGYITNICLSYDEKYLFSVGADSNIYGILFKSTQEDLEKAKQEKLKLGSSMVYLFKLLFIYAIIINIFKIKKTSTKSVYDIDDPTAYSIEEAKQKSEHDKMISISESKKQEMRTKITNLRKLFKDLTIKNEQLVPRLKLNKNVCVILSLNY